MLNPKYLFAKASRTLVDILLVCTPVLLFSSVGPSKVMEVIFSSKLSVPCSIFHMRCSGVCC